MKLTLRDKYRIAISALPVPIGVAILVRCAVLRAPVEGYLIGAVFLGYGIYRVRQIALALRSYRAP